MPHQQSAPSPLDTEAYIDGSILELLTSEDEGRPWSVEEVTRELGGGAALLDGLSRLHRVGLIHRTADGLVFATRAAVRYSQIRL